MSVRVCVSECVCVSLRVAPCWTSGGACGVQLSLSSQLAVNCPACCLLLGPIGAGLGLGRQRAGAAGACQVPLDRLTGPRAPTHTGPGLAQRAVTWGPFRPAGAGHSPGSLCVRRLESVMTWLGWEPVTGTSWRAGPPPRRPAGVDGRGWREGAEVRGQQRGLGAGVRGCRAPIWPRGDRK